MLHPCRARLGCPLMTRCLQNRPQLVSSPCPNSYNVLRKRKEVFWYGGKRLHA